MTKSTRPLERLVPSTVFAVVLAFVLLAMPAPRRDWVEVAAAAVVAVSMIALATAHERLPRSFVVVCLPLAYLAVAALLRDGAGGSLSGFAGLFLLPIIWLAFVAGRAELIVGLAGMLVAEVTPLLAIGGPDYPVSGWRGTVVQFGIAAVAGFAIQGLVAQTAERAAELERAAHAKDDFLALVSHELRTPLTSIIGYVEMLAEDRTSTLDEQRRFLEIVLHNAERLARLVNDLLFVARADLDRLDLTLGPVEIAPLLAEVAGSARPAAEAKGVELWVEATASGAALGDRERLRQVLDNLVSNGVKFTPEGGRVAMSASRSDGHILIGISDTGVGIAESELPHLFQRFYRTPTALAQAIPGTGLGLVIAQAIAHAHGGEIRVDSRLGEGTRFTFAIPRAEEP